ncbi:MAG: hypothetical protein EOP53_14990 [Sphingobacteriales bacterium]|nr:MAG: hypothetical protein EOP53_14990 [Sphingobacteriales bacterium]
MIKLIAAFLFTSIFFGFDICHAQNTPELSKPTHKINICNITDTVIHLSEISKITGDSSRIFYTDASGNVQKLDKYMIAISPKHGNAYFETGLGVWLSKRMKEHFKKAKVGDLVVITHVDEDKSTAKSFSGNATKLYKIAE